MPAHKTISKYLPYLIFTLALALRIYNWPNQPGGLNQDELSSIIEAKSLLLTWADRWGNHLPAYFQAFGSGQNVLYSYLSVPFVYLFGVNIYSVRIVQLILSLATLSLVYWLTKKLADRSTALIALTLVALSPWHISLSRWGLESNLLPFFLLLGVAGIVQARKLGGKWIYLATLPFVLALYSYGLAIVVVPILLGLIFWDNHKNLSQNKVSWTIGALISGFFAAPFGFFLIKNYITKTNFAFENWLPFSAPILFGTRFSDLTTSELILSNLRFFAFGLSDNQIFNSLPFIPNFSFFLWPFAAYGIYKARQTHMKILTFWVLASLPLSFIMEINVNRSNSIYLPLLMLASFGVVQFYSKLKTQKTKFTYILASLLVIQTLVFSLIYFNLPPLFKHDFEPAFKALSKQPGKKFVTSKFTFNYLYTIYSGNIDIADFQKESIARGYNKDFSPKQIGDYYFDPENQIPKLNQSQTYYYIGQTGEYFCQNQDQNIIYSNNSWAVGKC
jgi:4-amino-4-deoxy-L-arabinose transferase-like glycosyltransferase